ncbi:MAG: site-specific DNA-methyltransferase, partial [Planctomycetes bacterium]|nr:site-specific DNA-methyltransferase [Planctomycetota bacterium]
FPVELPRRLIRMFTFAEERVLDQFVGSGTTLLAARELGREGIGVDLDASVEPIIRERVGALEVLHREEAAPETVPADAAVFGSVVRKQGRLDVVTGPNAFRTQSGRDVVLLGTRPLADQEDAAAARLQAILSRRSFLLTDASRGPLGDGASSAYVHLSDRTFVNSRLIREGLLGADVDVDHPHRAKFMKEAGAE